MTAQQGKAMPLRRKGRRRGWQLNVRVSAENSRRSQPREFGGCVCSPPRINMKSGEVPPALQRLRRLPIEDGPLSPCPVALNGAWSSRPAESLDRRLA